MFSAEIKYFNCGDCLCLPVPPFATFLGVFFSRLCGRTLAERGRDGAGRVRHQLGHRRLILALGGTRSRGRSAAQSTRRLAARGLPLLRLGALSGQGQPPRRPAWPPGAAAARPGLRAPAGFGRGQQLPVVAANRQRDEKRPLQRGVVPTVVPGPPRSRLSGFPGGDSAMLLRTGGGRKEGPERPMTPAFLSGQAASLTGRRQRAPSQRGPSRLPVPLLPAGGVYPGCFIFSSRRYQ